MYKLKVLCDINIILDVLLKRDIFFDNSYKIFEKINNWEIEWFLSWISIDTIAYILKRNWKNINEIKKILKELLQIFNIAEINKSIILNSLNNDFFDIEDSIQYESSIYSMCNYIVTRNKKDFIWILELDILTPEEFLKIK
jgi:predicted nucleic acid-binding protein